jgi:hypothetical protein
MNTERHRGDAANHRGERCDEKNIENIKKKHPSDIGC